MMPITPLSSGSLMERIFATMRMNAISGSQAFVKIAFALACIFVLIRLIKLAYDIISDEQHGGFGGVKLWDVLKPIVFLGLIQGAPLVVGAIDYTTNIVVSSVSNSRAISNADAAFDAQLKEITESYRQQRAAEDEMDEVEPSGPFSSLINWIKLSFKKLWSRLRIVLFETDLMIGGRWIPWLCVKLFTILGLCFLIVSNVFLCVLAMCTPFVLCLELLDIWKGNLRRFITMYVQVSFWKIILVVVQWVIAEVRVGATSQAMAVINDLHSTGGSGTVWTAAEGAIWLQAIICVAGIMCIKKIPSWASSIAGGGVSESTGGAGEIAGAMNAAPGKAAVTAGKLML